MNKVYEDAFNLTTEIINNIIPNDPNKDDLIQDIVIVILEKPPNLIKSLHEKNELRYYITRTAMNNIFSKNSPFYYKYKKHHQIELTDYKDYSFFKDDESTD